MSNNDSHAGAHHPASYYIRIYWILAALLVVSILGPLYADKFGAMQKVVVMVTAYGIAIVKSIMVAGKFMHLNIEKKFIWWLLITCLVAMFVCFAALAPDIMNDRGANWINNNPFVETIPDVHHCHPK
jgi:predicted MFS family arabinose efflux permease